MPTSKHSQSKKKKTKKTADNIKPIEFDWDWTLVSYKNITEGSVFLGCIKKVTQYHLIVSLPNRLIGYVSVRDISSSYAKLLTDVADGVLNSESVLMLQDLYTPGEFIVIQVKSVVNNDGRINVGLTVDPSKTNISLKGTPLTEGTILQCSVTSETENGFIMDTGLPSVRAAFLSRNFVDQTCAVGKVLLCFVLSSEQDKGTELFKIRLSSQNKLLATILLKEDSVSCSFYPGSAADVTVTKVTEYGLKVNYGTTEGVVNKIHLPVPFQEPSEYSVGQVLRARVLYSTELPHVVYFSMLPVLCSLGTEDASVQSLKTMETIESATVYAVSNSEVFIYLRDNFCGVCSRSELRKKTKKIKVKDSVQCRVLDYWPMDDIYIVGSKAAILNEKVYSMESLKIGEDVMVKIIKIVKCGAVVKIGKFVKGFVPDIHFKKPLSDDSNADIPARVLIFKDENKVFFTLRDDLINPKLPMVTEFNSESVGATVAGVVFAEKDNGLRMEFFNGATGFLPRVLFSPEIPTEKYTVGRLVECKVKSLWSNKSALLTMEEEWDDVDGTTKKWMCLEKDSEIIDYYARNLLRKSSIKKKRVLDSESNLKKKRKSDGDSNLKKKRKLDSGSSLKKKLKRRI